MRTLYKADLKLFINLRSIESLSLNTNQPDCEKPFHDDIPRPSHVFNKDKNPDCGI